ncbi:MAG: ABC transporter permease [Bacteroidales bacterium]|jgi:ABC-2 type transport system permease protein|nr:ABC transporter permease [Bacteroidales bacterium]
MKRFYAFVKKEFYHIFRDKRTLIILFGIPIIQLLIFGYVITTELKDVKIAVYDPTPTELTQNLIHKLESSGYFIVEKMLDSPNEAEELFKKGEIREIILFETGISDNFEKRGKGNIQLLIDASDPNMGSLVNQYTQGIIRSYQSQLTGEKHAIGINIQSRMLFNTSLKSVFMFVPGIMAMILMLISAMMTSISIAREKEMGTMEVLLVSPLRPLQIIIGKVTPYVFLSFINAFTIIILGNTVFGIPINGSLILLFTESLLFILLALSLGIFISTISKSQQVAMFISLFALMLPTILLSGFIFPIESMPKILQWLSILMPPRWFIVILKSILLKGTGLAFIWKETLILLGMTIFFIIMSVKKFKIRLE